MEHAAAGASDQGTSRSGRDVRAWARRHRVFLVALVVGLALRVVVVAAYQPALWFQGDSFSYVTRGVSLSVHSVRPMGYGVLLRLLEPLPHSLAVLTGLQHLLGLATAVLLYALLVRLSVPRWASAVAGLPVLLDGYQLQLEHLVMSDTLYAALTTAAVVALLWHERPPWWLAAAGGLLLGAAAVTRTIGLPVAAALLVVLLLRGGGLRAVAVAALACALPTGAYLTWFHAETGRWAFTHSNGVFLYSRVMAFADCSRITLTPAQRQLCDPRPPEQRPESSRYIWNRDLPLGRLPGGTFVPTTDRLAQGFALAAIRTQPLDYLRVVTREVGFTFSPAPPPVPAVDLPKYEFVADPEQLVPDYARESGLRRVRSYDSSVTSLDTATGPRLPAFLDRYQDVVRLPGPALAVLAVFAVVPVLARGAGPLRVPALALSAVAAALLVVPPMTAQFDPRYVLAAVPLLAAAAALGATSLVRACGLHRGGGMPAATRSADNMPSRPPPAPEPPGAASTDPPPAPAPTGVS